MQIYNETIKCWLRWSAVKVEAGLTEIFVANRKYPSTRPYSLAGKLIAQSSGGFNRDVCG